MIDTLRRILAKNYPRPLAEEQQPGPAGATEGVTAANAPRRRLVNTYYLWDSSKMPLVGNLNETPYPLFLAEAARRSLTGYLTLTFEQVKKAIAFDQGRPVSVSSNIVGECLGQMLHREGRINKEALELSLAHMREQRLRQGDVLVRMGVINAHDLQEALSRQFMMKLFSVFTWTNARYAFAPATEAVRVMNAPTLSPFSLLREGLLTEAPQDFPLTWLKPYRTSIVNINDGAELLLRESGFTLKEIRRLTSLSGKESLEELLRNSALTSREMAVLLLSALLIGGVRVEQPLPEKTGEAAKVGGMDDVFLGIDENNLLQAHVRFHMEQAKANAADKPAPPPPAKIAEQQGEARDKMELVEMMQVMQRLSPEQQATYKALFDKRTALRKSNHFERLGVDQNATVDALKKAFRELAKLHHPDTTPGKEVPEIRQIADEVFSLLTKAHETLTDPALRKPYIEHLNGASQQDATSEVARILAAEQYFHEGTLAIKRKDWLMARKQLEEAIKLHAEDGAFYCELGWVLFNLSPNDMVSRQTAFRYLAKGLEMQPRNADAQFYIGAIHKSSGDLPKAAEAFLEALRIDSKHARARSEVHLLKMRKVENDRAKNAGFLGGLFKKKS